MAYLQERNQIVEQVRKYRYIDGTFEIQAGITAIIAGLFQVTIVLPMLHASILSQIPFQIEAFLPLIFAILMVAVNIYLPKYIPKLRERITYQRTGFVDFDRPTKDSAQKTTRTLVILGGVLLAGFVLLVIILVLPINIDAKRTNSLLFLAFAAFLPIADFFVWYKADVQRYIFAGLLALVLGAGLYVYFLNTWNFANANAPLGCYFIGIGVTELLLGLVTLRNYLRQYPIMSQVEE